MGLRRVPVVMLLWLALAAATARAGDRPAPMPEPPWAAPLLAGLDAADREFPGDLGVYVHHLGRDEYLSYHADQSWYLASGVKVPVAIAVLRLVERGELRLDDRLVLEADDLVDGAGATNRHPVGARLRVDYLLDQMVRYSDNTATDLLIRRVGIDQVNEVGRELLAAQDLVITSLADVRRLAYSGFHARAAGLGSQELLALKRAAPGPERIRRLAELLEVSPAEFLFDDLDSAFEAYYASRVNSARLSDFGRMLAALSNGLALRPESTAYLVDLMARAETGKRRLRAGLPPQARFAHKTGTQHRRACDLGIVSLPVQGRPEHVVVAACARGASLARSEKALRAVGAAVTRSGVLARSTPRTQEEKP